MHIYTYAYIYVDLLIFPSIFYYIVTYTECGGKEEKRGEGDGGRMWNTKGGDECGRSGEN